MKYRKMYLNKKYRRRRLLLAIALLTLAFLSGIAYYGFMDVLTRGLTQQLDGQAQWAVQESGIKIVEVQE